MKKKERRKAPRITCENLISYFRINERGTITGRNGYVHCKNISLVGVLFTAFELITEGTLMKIELQLDISENEFENVIFFGHVVRCDPHDSSDAWNIAVKIFSMLEAKKRLMFINWLANKDDEYHFL